jgi:hypothetical protein
MVNPCGFKISGHQASVKREGNRPTIICSFDSLSYIEYRQFYRRPMKPPVAVEEGLAQVEDHRDDSGACRR